MKYELFDSHCHVDDPRFAEDIDEVLTRMTEHGVTRYAVIGSDMASSRHAIDFAQAHEGAYAVVGIHPHEAKTYQEILDILFGDIAALSVFLLHRLKDLLAALFLEQGNYIIGNFVYRMDAAGADIQYDVIAAQFILMNHTLLLYKKNAADIGGISGCAITCSP